MSTKHLLTQIASLINEHGPDSAEVKSFIQKHEDDRDFVELANLSRELKKSLTSPASQGVKKGGQSAGCT